MKFLCEKSEILKILTNVSRSVSSKSNIPALEGIHITVIGSIAYFEGFNMEYGIKSSMEVQSAEEGSIVVPAKLFTEIIKKLPESIISFSSEGSNVSLNCLESNFTISAISASEFPELPSIGDETGISVSSGTIKDMVRQTIFSVADSGDNSIHSGELWEIKDGILTVVAVDGFRMSIRKENVNIDGSFKVVIPGKALSEVMRLLPSDDTDIKIYLSERYVFFELGSYLFLSRLLEGDYIDYKSAIPMEYSTKLKLNVKNAISSLERVSVLIDDRLQTPVKAILEPPNCLRFSCSTSLGCSSDEIESEISGEILEIAFNDKYFLDVLKNCDSDEVIVELTSALRPIKIVPVSGDSFVFIVLPVRMKE